MAESLLNCSLLSSVGEKPQDVVLLPTFSNLTPAILHPSLNFMCLKVFRNCRGSTFQRTVITEYSISMRQQPQNTGAKVRSAKLTKVFSLSITLLTTCLCNVKEHVANSRDIRQ